MTGLVRTGVVVLLVLGAGGAYAARAWRAAHRLAPEQVAGIPERLQAIPVRTASPRFTGERDVLDAEIVRKSGADHAVAIDFRDEDGGAVRLHVGAAARTDAWFHPPAVCLPAQGWITGRRASVPLWPDLPGADDGTRVWRLTLHRAGHRLLVYYWYQYGARIVTSRAEQRRLRFLDLLAGERDRPAQIVIFYAPADADETHGERRIASLARALWPHLLRVTNPED